MIRKLRVKLVAASMVSLFIVLLIIMGVISMLNYQGVMDNADAVLSLLAENDGSFPDWSVGEDRPPAGELRRKEPRLSPELPYESRYFTVFFNASGDVISVNTGKIKAVDTSAAIAYAQGVLDGGNQRGFSGNYRYMVYASGEETHMIFLDCSRDLETLRSFIVTGALTSLAGLFAVLLLLIFLSGRIVKPFLRNYEKQKRFITDAGHELKTPLTIIDADAEILEMDLGKNEWLGDIRAQTNRLTNLTNALILLARTDEEQPQAQMIAFPLSDVVEEESESFQALAKTRGISLSVSVTPMLSIRGDENAIRRLVSILLDNAVKYTPAQGRISLTLERQRNAALLQVYNTAEHVSKQDLARLFDRFYRTDQSRNSQTGGYGLGLSIASAIVNVHKGKITASTQDEKSLRISVSLPL